MVTSNDRYHTINDDRTKGHLQENSSFVGEIILNKLF